MLTYHVVGKGIIGDWDRGRIKREVVAFPRKGGQKIILKPMDRKQAFALILQQNKGK
jgi:hypothetical protein